MRGTGLVMMLSGGLLWGCAERGVPGGSPEPPTSPRAVAADRAPPGESGARACPAARYRALVGQPIAVIDTTALSRPFRVVHAGQRTTADHRPERMNIVVAANGRVVKVRCG